MRKIHASVALGIVLSLNCAFAAEAKRAQPAAQAAAQPEVPASASAQPEAVAPAPATEAAPAAPEQTTPPATETVDAAQPAPLSRAMQRKWGATISAQVPHPLFVDVEHRFNPKFTAALGGGGLKVKFTADGTPVTASIFGLDLRGRWHPFSGTFFLGAALGTQALTASGSVNVPVTGFPGFSTVRANVDAKINSLYLTPHLGWFKVFNSGFVLGLDFGVQLPMSPKTEVVLTSDQELTSGLLSQIEGSANYQEMYRQVQDAGEQIGKIPLPYLTVLRLGWMF